MLPGVLRGTPRTDEALDSKGAGEPSSALPARGGREERALPSSQGRLAQRTQAGTTRGSWETRAPVLRIRVRTPQTGLGVAADAPHPDRAGWATGGGGVPRNGNKAAPNYVLHTGKLFGGEFSLKTAGGFEQQWEKAESPIRPVNPHFRNTFRASSRLPAGHRPEPPGPARRAGRVSTTSQGQQSGLCAL